MSEARIKRSVGLLAVALAGAGLVVCGGGGGGGSAPSAAVTGTSGIDNGPVPTSHTLTLSFLQDPGQPPDPAVYYAGQGLLLTDNLYDGLLQYAPNMRGRQIIPDLATSWTVSPDNETYTLQLRQGVTFHDGTPFTSAAVQPSIMRDAAVDGGPAYMALAVASVQTPGPYTVVIKLSAPNTSFLDYLAAPYGPRMYSPTGLAANAGKDNDQTYLQTHDLGTGPYVLTKAQVGVDYQMQAYPKYWGKAPYYTTINIPVIDDINTQELEFQNGQIAAIMHDLPASAINSFEKNTKVSVQVLPTLQSEYAYINPTSSFLTSAANRVAVGQAFNFQQIVAQVYPGRGSVPPSLYPHDLVPVGQATEDTTYNPAPLTKIVSNLPSSQRHLTIGYDTSSPDDGLIAEILANQLDATGLSVNTVGISTSTIYSWPPPGTPTGAPDILVDYVWPDAYDPYQWSHIALDPNGGINYLHCNVPNSGTNLDQALATDNTTLFGQVGTDALNQGCLFNLANRDDVFVTQPWLKGVPAGHVSAEPNSIVLADLYPG